MEEFVWTSDALQHYTAGFMLSMADYFKSTVFTEKEDRIQAKEECASAIEKILAANEKNVLGEDGEPNPAPDKLDVNSAQYAMNVGLVREYLTMNPSLSKNINDNRSGGARFIDAIKGFRRRDFLGENDWKQNMLLATYLEIGYDSIWGAGYWTNVVGESPLGELWHNIYEIPAFGVGLMAGKASRAPLNWIFKNGTEKRLDKSIKKAVSHTGIVDLVMHYEAPETVKQELESQGLGHYARVLSGEAFSKMKKIGTAAGNLLERAGDTFDREPSESYEEKRQKSIDRFDELTRNN